ncbi:MAG: hypothetical protein QG563_253 [Patescibacteria group bacterium]|jgi:hypothetical protein|nr:hypothetical protein [Patescibacteria group bacterium]
MKKMKKILILLSIGVALIASPSYGQKKITVSRSAAYPDNVGDRLHKIANDFATTVGDHLKAEYPMKIDSASLKLTMECFNDTVRLSYHVALVECDSNEAHFYFDRRGALSKDVRPYVAGADAEVRCADQALVVARAFKKMYGQLTFQRYIDVDVKCSGFTYALSEYFLAAKK